MTPRFLLAAATSLIVVAPAGRARAQALNPGLAPPAAGVATAQGVGDVTVNPAALVFQTGHELRLQYASEATGTDSSAYAWRAAYGLTRRKLAAAMHATWSGGRTLAAERWLGSSVALGGPAFAVGLTARGLATPEPSRAGLWAYDFGIAGRPIRHLSYGFTVRDLASRSLDPAYAFGLGTRLFDGRLLAGASWRWSGRDPVFAESSTLAWNLRFRLMNGLTILAAGRHRLDGLPGANRIEVGLRLDLSHLGLSATGTPEAGGATTESVDLRISSARHPTIVGGVGLALLDLDDLLAEPSGLFFGKGRRDRFVELLRLLDQARRDGEVSGVVLRASGGTSLSMAEIEELRAAITRLRESGKHTAFYLEAADDALYYLACAADRILAAPGAVFLVNGLSSSSLFLGKLLGRLGIKAEFAKIGRYKNAPDTLLRETISEAQEEVRTALMKDVSTRYLAAIAKARAITPEALKTLLATGILGARAALEAGLIDAIAYPDELASTVLTGGAQARLLRRYPARRHADRPWGARRSIAVVEIRGTIVPGETPSSLFDDATKLTGARTFAREMEQAARDPDVVAIVLRIDSGGGDAHASDLMWRSVQLAAREKPVIASLGTVAASGGYYAASAATRIVADPSTLTGSIGIFAGHVDLSGLLGELGVAISTLRDAPMANLFGYDHPWSEAERAAMERFVEAGYALFLDRVATGRKLERAAIDAVGQGRVWTGAQAKERGLVDELGGFDRAIALAKAQAGLEENEVVTLDFVESAGPHLAPFGGEGGPLSLLPPALLEKLKVLLPVLDLLARGRVLALMPFTQEIH